MSSLRRLRPTALLLTAAALLVGAAPGPAVAATGADPVPTYAVVQQPWLSGDLAVGARLLRYAGEYDPRPVEVAVQWFTSPTPVLADGAPVDGATSATYVVAPADLHRYVWAVETVSGPGVATLATATSPVRIATGEVRVAPAGLRGSRVVGGLLRGAGGAVVPTDPARVVVLRSWQRDRVEVLGAHGPAYRVRAADAGHRLRMRVAAVSTAQPADTATVLTREVQVPAVCTRAPALRTAGVAGSAPRDRARVGRLVVASTGRWHGAGYKLSYRWLLDGVPVAGQHGRAYRPGPRSTGRILRVRVVATRPGWPTVARTSAGVPIGM